ncbi:DnaJ C-terminal domain-containing protein [Robiginitomaculum antarcticum]|uniref:DnaJ C-terminal domain-containing protein n=1 Tax=Robiginitomaculum antarcticum TaxID=437507 RepID=UPI000380559E|nr:DnaJ C-terminal domain-containing protein [Robiginitomaculum antarcticum]
MAENPYTLLGIKKTATETEIRKAYRALAKKLHPDVNPDEKAQEKFKKISAAYTLLTDKDMRARYDSGQVDGQGQQQAQNPFGAGYGGRGGQQPAGGFQGQGFDDMNDIFASLFGMQMGGQRGGARLRPQKGGDIRYKLTIDFLEAVTGGAKSVSMGDGQKLSIKIPEGTDDGTTLRLRGKGQPGANGGLAGDAMVEISVRPHKYFRRDGKDLRLDHNIDLQTAVVGGKTEVMTPTGTAKVSIKAGTSSGKTLRLKGKGVKGGDLYVKLMIVLPDDLSELSALYQEKVQ